MARDNGHGASCAYCNRTLIGAPSRSALMATRDHVVPKCRGGWQTVWSCFTCNTMKGNMEPGEWAEFMRTNPEWWKTGPKPFSRSRPFGYRPTVARVPINYQASPETVRALARRIVNQDA